jgi:hypothetical protein
LITTNDLKSQELKKISADVSQVKQQIENNLQQINAQSPEKIKEQIKLQVSAIDKEIKSGQAQGDLLATLQAKKVKLESLLSDPKKISQESEQNLQLLQKQKEKAESQANEKMLKTGIRTSLASLLLSIAYIVIGWTGLKRVLR